MPITRLCLFCGTPFNTKQVYINRGGGKYCKHSCWAQARHQPTTQNERFNLLVQKCNHLPFCFYCCWPWLGHFNSDTGYGYFNETINHRQSHQVLAHRKSWMIYNKQTLPRKEIYFVVKHDCNNKQCVNPWHLTYAPKIQNAREAVRDGLIPLGERHWSARFYDSEIALIRTLLQTNIRQKVIARMFLISQQYISQIKRGHRRSS